MDLQKLRSDEECCERTAHAEGDDVRRFFLALASPEPIAVQEGATLVLRAPEFASWMLGLDVDVPLRDALCVLSLRIDGVEQLALARLPLQRLQFDDDRCGWAPLPLRAGALIRLTVMNVSRAPVALLDASLPFSPERIRIVGETEDAPSTH